MKTENFLQKILLNLKKLQISKISKLLDYPKSKYLYNGSKSIIKKKQVYFRSLRVMTSYNFSNKDKSDEEAEGTTEYFCPRNFNNFTISKFIIFRSNYFRIKNRFLKRIHKNVSFRPILETFNKFYKNFNRTMFAEIDDYHVDNKKPVAYILRAIDKIR